jgi:hypothetical protein
MPRAQRSDAETENAVEKGNLAMFTGRWGLDVNGRSASTVDCAGNHSVIFNSLPLVRRVCNAGDLLSKMFRYIAAE